MRHYRRAIGVRFTYRRALTYSHVERSCESCYSGYVNRCLLNIHRRQVESMAVVVLADPVRDPYGPGSSSVNSVSAPRRRLSHYILRASRRAGAAKNDGHHCHTPE